MAAKVDLRLCGSMDHLRLVWQTGETLLDSIPFTEDPEGTRYNILLALQEMTTNVLRHAYAGDETKPIEFSFDASEEAFDVAIRDMGPEFDPLQVDTETLVENGTDRGEDLRPGGYGILITKMVMDSMTYERRQGWNILRMRKLAAVPAGHQG